MRMRRLLAVLLLLSMLVSVVPTSVFAVETENGSDGETAATAVDPSTAPSDNLFVDKTVTLTEDGTYSINMEAYATGTPITKTVELGVPLDVVLVVDQSGSLKNSGSVDSMKNSIRDFMNALKANGEAVGVDHRVSICSFAGDDLGGLSGPADEKYGYSFAGDLWDLAWLNTGLYVDGKFQDYGTVEYTRIDSLDKLDTTRYYLVKYTRTLENGSSVAEYFRIYYYKPYGSWYIHNSKEGLVSLATRKKDAEDKTTSEDLIANYEVYDIGESTLQLDQADYAASWEYIADGQGNLNADVAAAINSLASNGGTRTSYGLKMARNMLKYITPGTDNDIRKKVVVVFTDGKAGAGWNSDGEMAATLAEANKIKASGVDIYTVGVYSNAVATDIASFMNQFSSNCGVIEFSENPTTEYEYNNLGQDTWANSVTGRYRTLPSFYKVENEDGTVEFCPVRVHVETRYRDDAGWVVTPPYKWTYITDTGEMSIPTELLNEDGTAITGLYKIGSGDYNSEAGYYQTSNSFDNLSSLFQTVLDKETIFYSEVELGTTAILKDVLADGFTLTDNTQITVSVVPGSVSEENSNLSPNELTSDKITWDEEVQKVLSFTCSESKTGTGTVTVGEETIMTLTAQAGEDGVVTVNGFDYANQFIGYGHDGYKLVVNVTGVEAVPGVTTNAATSTNKATSGVYEGPESDADKDGIPGEIETPFPVPNTYLTSEYYYLDETGKVTFEIKDFLMDEGINISDGYHFFNTAEPGTTLETDYGTVTVNGDGTVTYQLKEGVELEKDIICLFGKTEDITVKAATANANGYMWSEITILPPKDAVGKLHTDKSATLMGDGTYTIDLEAFATGTPAITALSTKQPLDVVLVVDQSGSLQYVTKKDGTKQFNGAPLAALKASVSSFVHELQANGDTNGLNHRISICGFGSDEYIGWSGVPEYDNADYYTYAGELKDIYFTNTGLFVNGEFKKYGASTYEPFIVEKVEDVVDNKIYVAREKGTQRYLPVYYYPGHTAWRLWVSSGWTTFFNKDITDEEKKAIKKAYGSDEAGAIAAIGEAEKKLNVWAFLEKYDLYYLNREVTVQLTDKDYQNSWENVSVNGSVNPDIAKTIDSLAGNGATFSSYGMRMARKMLENAPATADGVERKKVVIVFTDGVPGGTGVKNKGEAESTLAEAQKIKDGLFDKNGNAINAEIYTVGIYEGEKGDNDFMNQLSSNCASHKFADEPVSAVLDPSQEKYLAIGRYLTLTPYFYKLEKENGDVEYCPIKVFRSSTSYDWRYVSDEGLMTIPAGMVSSDDPKTITGVYTLESGEYDSDLGYYSNSDNFSDLPGLFREIVTEVSTYSSEVQLDAKAILKDVMADGFTLTNNTQITVSVVPGSVKEQFADVGAKRLGSEHIAWGTPQKVLTFKYSEAKEGTGKVVVNGAADQTEMTLSAQVTEDGIITVTGFNYAAALDNHKENAQYICAGHPGSKLVVTITGVEAKNGVTTDSFTVTNKGASGIYEASDSDMDGDGTFGEMQAYFPIPTTYLSSKTYYVDYNGELIIDPADFLMTIKGYSLDKYGYHGFGAPGTIIEMDHGTVTVLDDGKLKFTMKPDGLGITDTFYLFGHTDNATVKAAMANTTGNMWSKVTIITPEDITGKLFLDKEATLTDDGTYTIDLNAYATGTPAITTITEGVPLDVVLVIDQSGSLMLSGIVDELQGAVSSFVNELKINGEAYGVSHRVSVATYASAGTDGATGFLGDGFPRSESPEEGTNRLYPHWYNTGLFVNGKFKNYGTLEYIPVESVEAMGKQVRFLLDYDYEGDGIWERWVTDTASPWRFRTYKLKPTGFKNTPIKDANGKNITTNQALFDNYKLYTAGAATCTLTDDDYKEAWEYLAVGENGSGALNEDISRIISQIASSGGTRTSYGMKMAAQLIKNCPDDGIERKKIVIVFSDGAPGQNSYNEGDAQAALAEAKKIKNAGIEIYTVGVYPTSISANAETFMDRLSSNYSDHTFSEKTTTLSTSGYTFEATIGNAKMVMSKCFFKDEKGNYWPVAMSYPFDNTGMKRFYYVTDEGEVTLQNSKTTTYPGLYTLNHVKSDDPDANYFRYTADITKLEGMFKDIVKEATTVVTEARLDANMIMKDVLADGFKLTGNTTVTVSVVPGSVSTANSNIPADELTSDKITWGEPQQVLSFAYPTETEKSGSVVVNGAADRTEMTLNAKVTADGIITVDGFNYAGPTDSFYVDAQYIRAGHAGSKLVLTITGVEANADIVTGSVTTTNKGTSGIYESENSDLDEDGDKGELQASFPIPTTYLTSEFYYLDENNSVTFNPKDFLMTIKGINADPDGYNFFDVKNPGTKVETEHGTVTVNANGTVTYQLTNADWENEDVFYLFGKTDDPTVTGTTANDNGNMWSKITILPPKDASGKMHLDKEATLTDNGTYTIDLEAFATGTPASTIIKDGIPLDVVLVVDQSGSLFTNNKKYDGVPLQMLKESVSEFVEALKANGEAYGVNHRISMCGFASGELQGVSGTTDGGYSYASDMRYNTWVNTGLFVDGEFREYAKMNYIRINDPSELDVNRYYTVKFDPYADGNYEYVRSWYYGGHTTYRYYDGQRNLIVVNGDKEADTKELLLKSYEVYKLSKSTVQLKDDDYAASWENLASGENGQGSINPDILKSIDKLAANGATYTFYGLQMASRMLENAPDDGIQRKKVVIVFTDGEPGYGGFVKGDADAALSAVKAIKESGTEVFAVGVYSSASEAKVNTFMNQLSSNYKSHSYTTIPTRIDMSQIKEDTTGNTRLASNIDTAKSGISPYYKKVGDNYWPVVISTNYENPDVYYASYITDRAEEGGVLLGYGAWDKIPEIAGDVYMLAEPEVNENRVTDYYKYSGDINELSAMFQEIATNATTFSSQVSLDAEAILKDVMADGFKLTDNTTITVSVVPGSVKEEHANLDPDKLTEAHIDWSTPQQVLTFKYSEAKEGTGNVIVNGAADQTEMTLTAKVDENGVITVTGYNYADPADNHKENAQYICAGHPGSKLVVTITGVEAQSNVVTDSFTVTNKGASGIYEGPNSDMDGDGEKGEIQSSFPVPTTYMASKVYVVDYAKTMTINPADFKMTDDAVSVDVDGYNHFDPAVTAVTGTYGQVTVKDGKITYTPTRTNWNGYDSFYVFGTTDNATIKAATANKNGNMWAKVSVVPANNVYYEDTFVTNESTGVVGIVYKEGAWEVVQDDKTANADGNVENAESNESTTKDNEGNDHQGGVHGWEDNLADDTGFSDGSAHIAGTDGKSGATATFTFTGTGVDIYSRTNKETGMVLAMLYEGTATTDENGKNLVAKYNLMVDNLAASGDYYQVPTLSFFQMPDRDENGKIIKDENGNTKMVDLPYGTYTVKIMVSKVGASQTGSERFLYYLDGIRVYNPIQNQEGDSTVSGAYGEKELNANFVEIRDKLLDANSFSAEIDESAGPVFIDRITSEDGSHTDNTKTVEIGTYKVFGPKNEVYLSANQIVAFAVPYTEGAHYYIGMKSLTGETVKVIPNSTDDYVNLIVVGHTTDQYYEIIPEWEYDEHGNPTTGIIFVHADIANGDYKKDEDGNYTYEGAILALTKLKVTGPKAKNFKFARVSNDKLLEMIAEDLAPSLDMDDTNSSPDVGGNTPNKPNVDINKPSSDEIVDEQTALKNLMIDLLTRIFSDLRGWFKS